MQGEWLIVVRMQNVSAGKGYNHYVLIFLFHHNSLQIISTHDTRFIFKVTTSPKCPRACFFPQCHFNIHSDGRGLRFYCLFLFRQLLYDINITISNIAVAKSWFTPAAAKQRFNITRTSFSGIAHFGGLFRFRLLSRFHWILHQLKAPANHPENKFRSRMPWNYHDLIVPRTDSNYLAPDTVKHPENVVNASTFLTLGDKLALNVLRVPCNNSRLDTAK